MNPIRSVKPYVLKVSLILGLILLSYFAFVPQLLQKPIQLTDSWDSSQYNFEDEKSVQVWMIFDEIDISQNLLNYRAYVWPGSDLGSTYRNSVIFNEEFNLQLEDSKGEQVNVYPANKQIGTVGGSVLLAPRDQFSIDYYPLDSYKTSIYMRGWSFEPSALEVEERQTKDIPTIVEYLDNYPGTFTLQLDRVSPKLADQGLHSYESQNNDTQNINDSLAKGVSVVAVDVNRNNVTKFLASLVAFLMVLASGSLMIVTWAVLTGRRLAVLNAIVWATAVIFTIIQLRDLLPGAPPIGIYFDLIFYFPSLLAAGVTSALLLSKWISQDEYLG
jgi:hypothetical protein